MMVFLVFGFFRYGIVITIDQGDYGTPTRRIKIGNSCKQRREELILLR